MKSVDNVQTIINKQNNKAFTYDLIIRFSRFMQDIFMFYCIYNVSVTNKSTFFGKIIVNYEDNDDHSFASMKKNTFVQQK